MNLQRIILRKLSPSYATVINQHISRPKDIRQIASANRKFSVSHYQLCKFTANLRDNPLNDDRAHDLVFNLKDSERASIKLALEKYDALCQKESFQGKLAATQWRTRFGRRATVPTLGAVDATGSFCTFPENWLKLKAAEKAVKPCGSDLSRIFIVNAAPFVGFGFLDNFVMIIAGDYIEASLNTFMCISTMAAAGLGNTLSDVLGIGTAFYIERGCAIMGLNPPDLTPGQLELKVCRRLANLGRIIGITIGCLLGMVPLLFKKDKDTNDKDKDKEEKDSLKTAVSNVKN